MRALALLALLVGCNTSNTQARAQRIGSLEETIGGPHAIGTIGDYLLENDQIRLIVSKEGVGRVNTSYGGSLVDADLQRPGANGAKATGNDQLAELLPGFAFTVIDPTAVKVTADGSNGQYAEVTVEGGGGDLLQMVYLLNTGLVFPESLTFSNAYRLAPGKKYVEIRSTVKNTGKGAHPFPYLDPTQLKDLGFDIPNIENIQLSVPMGQLPLLGGEQTLFTPGQAGFNVRFAIEDTYVKAGGFPAFPGMVVDYVASRGVGVSYGLTVPDEGAKNYVNAYKDGYAAQAKTITPYSMLMPFTYAGVSAVYVAKPPALLMPGEEFTYTTYFIVGSGDVGSVLDTIYELRGTPTGTFGGRVVDAQTSAPITNASVVVLDAQGNPIDQLDVDDQGSFLGHLAAGAYSYRVLSDERLTTAAQPLTITAGQASGVFVQMDPPATLAVAVLDEQSRHAPVKVQLIGEYPAPSGAGTLPCQDKQCLDPRDFLYSLTLGERKRPTAFDGSKRFIEKAWWTKDGRLEAQVRPGTYDLVISRGPEYEVTTVKVDLRPGAFVAQNLTLTRAFPTDGWIAGDFHIHAQPSTDSGLPIDQRVISCAAEGLEVAVSTDHNFITDYAPVISASGLDPWMLGLPGMEMTTFEMGHFIGYPLKIDAGSTRGGEFEWSGVPPKTIFDQLRNKLAVEPGKGLVHIAHPRQPVLGYWAQFYIDAATGEPYPPTGILGIFAPYGDEFAPDKYANDFDTVELLTGRRLEDAHSFVAPTPLPPGPFPDPQPVAGTVVVGKDGRPQFPGVVETWMTMLDRGAKPTGMGASDSHQLLGDEPGYARTMLFVGSGKDVPGGFGRADVVDAITHHHAITTNGPFLEMTVGSHIIGDTVVASSGGVDVDLHVRAPTWAAVDHLIVYSNSVVILDEPIPPAQATNYARQVHLALPADAWIVAEVYGSGNMFPVLTPTEFPPLDATVIIKALSAGLDLSSLPIAASLKPKFTHYSRPYAITNPIWFDTDGNGFTPPRPPLPRVAPPATSRPDVRQQFDALPELTP
ncbi:MAG: CehA/McbA family metallohydrolase [Proteobacteria bacterium]|nr:CehA/McbA family metallohydrolase [Pseudomonadota bacterium]